MARMFLAGIGWVPDPPAGHRLRIHYPLGAVGAGGSYLGFPEVLVVERAPVDADVPHIEVKVGGQLSVPSAPVPYDWWHDHGDISLGFGIPPRRYTFPGPVQAVRFTYRGPDAHLQAWDVEEERMVADREVHDGAQVYLESSAIKHLDFLCFGGVKLEDLRTVDLFYDWGLPWEEIARLHVAATVGASLAQAQERVEGAASLSSEEWAELLALAADASASSPGTVSPEDPTPWEVFQTVLGLRWHHALLFGLAYFDGPRAAIPALDEIDLGSILTEIPPVPMAYRVREVKNRVPPSNVVVCPNWAAPALVHPQTPAIQDPSVRLLASGEFEARFAVAWQGIDPRTIGVEIEEDRSASPSIPGSTAVEEALENRSRRAVDPPMTGLVARVVAVPFHDVTVRARARAIDGWDRTSPFSAWTAPVALALVHNPQPPPLLWARSSGASSTLRRAVADPGPDGWEPPVPAWTPDVIVEKAAGRVEVCRQTTPPQTVDVTVSAPIPLGGRTYRSYVSGVPASALPGFVGGNLIVGSFRVPVTAVSGASVSFEVPDEAGGSATLFGPGPAVLQQDPTDPSLWTVVTDFPAIGLSPELVFPDPIPGPPDGAVVLSYATRVRFLGRTGPPSNVVSAVWFPPTPVKGPPFSVDLLGVDFYNRTVVKVELTTPSTGMFSIWWADGWSTDWAPTTSFKEHGVPGEHGAQSPQYGRVLYDVLSFPLARKTNRRITVGVQRVNAVGGQSEFEVLPVTLLATEPGP